MTTGQPTPQPPRPPARRTNSLGCLGVFSILCLLTFTSAEVFVVYLLDPTWFDRIAVWRGPVFPRDVIVEDEPVTGAVAGASSLPTPSPGYKTESLAEAQARIAVAGTPPPRFEVDWSRFPVAASASTLISRSRGGVVRLKDGSGIELPAGALPADTTVTVRRLINDGPEGRTMTITEVDAGKSDLLADATLTLPCPQGAYDDEFQVRHIHDGRMTLVPGEYDAASRQMKVRVRRCSPFIVGAAVPAVISGAPGPNQARAMREAELQADLSKDHVDPPMVIPYYHQAGAEWCWAASTQMILKAYGVQREIWEIAHELGLDYSQGIKVGGELSGSLDEIFQRAKLPTEGTRVGWVDDYHLVAYVIAELRLGRPVWIHFVGENHVLVAAGFNQQSVYVHDPAEPSINTVPVPWATFRSWVSNTINPAKAFGSVSTITVKAPLGGYVPVVVTTDRPIASAQSPVTISLQPDQLDFTHPPAFPRNNDWTVHFAWDGQASRGCRFCVPCPSPKHDRSAGARTDIEPVSATMSDTMTLRVTLANASPVARRVRFGATLDGNPIPIKTNPKWNLNPNSRATAQIVSADTVSINPNAGLVDVTLIDGGVKLSDVLPKGSAARYYSLRITATDLTASRTPALADEIVVDVPVGPAMPEMLRIETPEADPNSAAPPSKDTILRWDPVPGAGVNYEVYYTQVLTEPGRLVKETTDTQWTIDPALLLKRQGVYFNVVAKTGSLQSARSEYLEPIDLFEGTWAGTVKLTEGSIAQPIKDIVNLYVDAVKKKATEDRAKLANELAAAQDATQRIVLNGRLAQMDKEQAEDAKVVGKVVEFFDSVLQLAEWVARVGVPIKIKVKRVDGEYLMAITEIAKQPTQMKPMIPLVRRGEHTLALKNPRLAPGPSQSQTPDQPQAINLPPLYLRLHRKQEMRDEYTLDYKSEKVNTHCKMQWVLKREGP